MFCFSPLSEQGAMTPVMLALLEASPGDRELPTGKVMMVYNDTGTKQMRYVVELLFILLKEVLLKNSKTNNCAVILHYQFFAEEVEVQW